MRHGPWAAIAAVCLIPLWTAAAVPLSLDSPQAHLRTGETLSLEVTPENALDSGWTYEWSVDVGDVSGQGNEALYTAPSSKGYALVRVDVRDASNLPVATLYRPLLVYKQFALIKADDLVSYDGTLASSWEQYLTYMSETRRLKHSAGVITKSLLYYSLSGANPFTAAIRSQKASGLMEFWHHGYDHSSEVFGMAPSLLDPRPAPPSPLKSTVLTEFSGRPYAFQKERLEDGLELSREVLGFPMHTFGAPFGASDSVTTTVVDESLDIEVWFDGQAGSAKRVIAVDGNLVENPTGYPRVEQFTEGYDPAAPRIVMQVHPGFVEEDEETFIERFEAWESILDTVEANGATFITPFEYHRLLAEAIFPLHPDDDSDGDGVGDFDEGQSDEDVDGRPNFLDPDSDGTEGPRVRNLNITRTAAGVYEVTFDLFGPSPHPLDLVVEYVEGETAPVALSGVTGDLSNVFPGEGKTLVWDASMDLPGVELEQVQLRLTLLSQASLTPETVSLPAGAFTQGCPACASGDAFPPFPITHDAYEIGKYEVTNLELAVVLDYAYAQGYLFAEDGAPYAGGDVYHGGQMLVALSSPESQVAFSAGDFAPKIRDSLSMDEHPAVFVTWYGAVAYCNWRSEMDGLTPAYDLGGDWRLKYPFTNGYRLPTEAEWERASTDANPSPTALYGFGAGSLNDSRANYQEANPLALTGEPFTSPVGYYNGGNATMDSPSPAGAYDLSGNVAEWVHDQYAPYQERDAPLHNPRGSDTRPRRVIKGGSWSDDPAALEYASRENRYANHASNRVGFRVARAVHSGSGKTAPFALDTKAPFVESMAPVEVPDADAFDFTFLVRFSEPVDGLDLSMFSLSTSGLVEVPPSILSLSGAGASYTVSVATGVMQGDLSLVFDDPDSLVRDAGDNTLSVWPVSSAPVSIDTLAPAVHGIELIGAPGLREEQVQFLVTFSKPVIEVVAGDFVVLTSGQLGTMPAVLNVEGSGAARTVTVSVNQVDGLLGLAISDGDASIRDADDRPLGRTVDSGLVHIAETLPPELLSFEILGAPLPNAGEVEIGILFSEPVTGLDAGNFSLSLPGRVEVAAQITALSGSGAAYSLQVSTGDIESGISLTYAPDGVTDLVGNPSTQPQESGVLIAIDTIPPVVETIELVGTPDANTSSVTFEVLFSEAVLGFSVDDLIPEPQGAITVSPEVSEVSGTGTFYTVTMSVGEMEGSLGLGFLPQSVADLSGNAATQRFDSVSAHAADTRAPRLLSIEALTSSPTASDSVDFRLVFSEPVGGLNGEGDANLLIAANDLSYETVDTRFDGNLFTFLITVGGLSSGSGALSLNVRDATSEPAGSILDQNGNPLSIVTVPSAQILIDRTPPSPRCRALPLWLNAEGVATPDMALFNAGSTDDGGGPVTVLSISPDSFGCEDLGLNVVTATLSDELGNTAQCNTFVIVIDNLGACADPMEGEGGGEPEGEGEGTFEGQGEGVMEGEGEGEAPAQFHSGDWNGLPDGRFDLTELLRIIQLYNAGGLCCDDGTEDGYAPGNCKGESCNRHDADYADPPWVVSLSELLRAVQLFNLGSFESCTDGESEDGFCLAE